MKKTYNAPVLQKIDSIVKKTLSNTGSGTHDSTGGGSTMYVS